MSLIKKIFNPDKYIGDYRPLIMVMMLAAFSCFLWIGVVWKTGNWNYYYLLWNLFLAWLPLFFAYLLYHRMHFPTNRLRKWKFWVMTFLWLIFFPNAPYLITDLIHINERHNPASWGDAILLFSFALSGLAMGINSLYIMHINFRQQFNSRASHLLIGLCIFLSGFGIFLGRVQRWNSWDIVTRPDDLFRDILIQITNPTAIYMTFSFSALIGMVYLLLLSVRNDKKV